MATINYKEKYEKAVQAAMLAKQDTESAVTIGILEEIFPELKESEDEMIRKALIRYFTLSDEHAYNEACGVSYRDIVAYLEKQGEQKPVEPQQDMLSQEKYAKAVDECIYGEQKPAWSEEDEKMIRGLIVICDEWTTRHSFYPIENCEIEKLKNWLESLKERCTWKPSDEQMKALEIAIRRGIKLGTWEEEALKSLKEQLFKLKKLKE